MKTIENVVHVLFPRGTTKKTQKKIKNKGGVVYAPEREKDETLLHEIRRKSRKQKRTIAALSLPLWKPP